MFSRLKIGRTVLGVALAIYAVSSGMAQAQEPCGNCLACKACCPIFCPHYKYCAEGSPRICITYGCPKPVCSPCTMPNWGYHETCWSPWPWGPDFSRCPVQPPASMVVVPGPPMVGLSGSPADTVAPPARTIDRDRVLPLPRPIELP